MCKTIKQKVRFKAAPQAIYGVLADSKRRSALTGRKADISKKVGGAFSTDNGRVTGVNVDLVPAKRLVQAWRRNDFPDGVYSMAAITLAPTAGGGTELVLTHRGVPKHLIPETEDYWRRTYWERMKTLVAVAFAVALSGSVLSARQNPAPLPAISTQDIDRQIWTVIVDTVAKDDITRMGAAYTPDAVIVNPNSTQPIKDALDRWGRDMVANKAKGTSATVEFRFSRRLDNATTAFESGIFNYATTDKNGVKTPGYYPFEELLVKTGGQWHIVMERQFAGVTEADWNKLPRWP